MTLSSTENRMAQYIDRADATEFSRRLVGGAMNTFSDSTTCAALKVEATAIHPNTDAVVQPIDRVTYVELVEGTTRRACELIALGVMTGDHISNEMARNTIAEGMDLSRSF